MVKIAQAQRRTDPIQDRMQQADQLLTSQLRSAGYTAPQANEIVRLAHQLYTVRGSGPTPSPRRVVLQPTGVQSEIQLTDLTKARDYLMEVARRPRDSPNEVLAGITHGTTRHEMTRDFTLYSGPIHGPTVTAVQVPAPVRTFVYNITVGGNSYQVEMNTPLRPGGASSLEQSRFGQLQQIMRNHPEQVLAITSSGSRVSADQFTDVYNRAYNAMQRQALLGQEPDQLISIETVRRRPQSG